MNLLSPMVDVPMLIRSRSQVTESPPLFVAQVYHSPISEIRTTIWNAVGKRWSDDWGL